MYQSREEHQYQGPKLTGEVAGRTPRIEHLASGRYSTTVDVGFDRDGIVRVGVLECKSARVGDVVKRGGAEHGTVGSPVSAGKQVDNGGESH